MRTCHRTIATIWMQVWQVVSWLHCVNLIKGENGEGENKGKRERAPLKQCARGEGVCITYPDGMCRSRWPRRASWRRASPTPQTGAMLLLHRTRALHDRAQDLTYPLRTPQSLSDQGSTPFIFSHTAHSSTTSRSGGDASTQHSTVSRCYCDRCM